MKNILISQRISSQNGDPMDSLEQSYINYYRDLGFNLIPVPNIPERVSQIFKEQGQIGGIILSGGGGISTGFYGDCKDKDNELIKERDLTEEELVRLAIENKIPLLGECRGMQFLNVCFGGRLVDDIKNDYQTTIEHVGETHEVIIANGYLGINPERIVVNSYHNSGISEEGLSNELKSFAKSSDGLVEGFYHRDYKIAGVMWHPERSGCSKGFNERIIKSLFQF